MPEELQTEVCNIVQEAVTKTISKKKKHNKAKCLSEEALLRKEVKDKGEKERYTHLNAEFQRITRRDKKAFFSEQCKEIEENNRMGKTRDLFKKIRDTKGPFHAKMGTIKDRNGMDLTESSSDTHNNIFSSLWKILKEMGIPDHLTCLLRKLYPSQEATELDMEQWTASKLGKGYGKAVYCHLAY